MPNAAKYSYVLKTKMCHVQHLKAGYCKLSKKILVSSKLRLPC